MYNIAIVGSKKRVTVEFLEVLEDNNFEGEIHIIDISKSIKNIIEDTEIDDFLDEDSSKNYNDEAFNFRLKFKDSYLPVKNFKDFDFSQVDFVCYFEDKEHISKIIDAINNLDVILIDNSLSFLNDKNIPIIIPEINKHSIDKYKDIKIITNPSSCVIQMLQPLSLLHKELVVKRVVCSTYQSVSGEGNDALAELFEQTRGIYAQQPVNKTKSVFSKQIAFNVIPHIGNFLDTGSTEEEQNLNLQTKLILDENINITSTCVRVPVFIGDAMSLNIEFDINTTEEEIRNLLSSSEDLISVIDYRVSEGYVTPTEVVGENKIYVSRIRKDKTQNNTFNMWIVADNLRRGVSLNIINIMNTINSTKNNQ